MVDPSLPPSPLPAALAVPGADAHALELRAHLGEGAAAITIADAAARSGLSLADAERALHRLSRRHGGHLAVTDRGELLFRFPEGFVHDRERRDARRQALARVGRGALTLASWSARLALTVFLVGYSLVFALGILVASVALAFVAEDDAPISGAGLLLWGLLEVVMEGLFWSTHPALAGDGQARALRDQHTRSHLYERINRVFFGPPQPPQDRLALRRLAAQEIRARAGRVGRSDIERVTALPPAQADALLTELLVDYDGNVEVTPQGAIVHVFPALRPTAATQAEASAPPAWSFVRALPQFVGNPPGSTAGIVAAWSFVTAMAGVGVALDLPWYLGSLPLGFALALATIPLVRLPAHRRRLRAARDDNGWRALLRLVHDAADARRGLDEAAVDQAWRDATRETLSPQRRTQLLLEAGGDLEIAADGSTAWRFAALEREQQALAAVRAGVDDDERAVGEVVFRSDA